MPRGRKPRYWVKLDCHGVLHGSINWLLTLEEQAVWLKAIAYSEICGGPSGWICDNDSKRLPDEYVAQELHCPLEVYQSMVKKMITNGSLEKNGTGALHLVHFDDYQFTEYDRQKPYRQKKAQERDPDKYTSGKLGHLVARTAEDVKQIKSARKGLNSGNDQG